MNLFKLLREECLVAGAQAASKEEILKVIASAAKKCDVLAQVSEDKIYEALLGREELGSTGFGDGIAIPHCRIQGVDDFVVGIVTAPGGVPFGSMDDQPAKLFVFIIAPDRESNEHIRILSAISQVLRVPGAIRELLAETTPKALAESFLRHCRDEVESKDHAGKNLFHVFIQNEDWFEDILQVFAAMDSCSVMVVEAEQSGAYLGRMPLFAGFLSDSDRGFNRIIIASVEKKLTNETIRQVELVTSSLDQCQEALLTVQDVFYTSGHLNA